MVIETGGIGYEINVPTTDLEKININSSAKLFIYEHLREDIHALYGFLEEQTKFIFTQLISVSGVGPKVGLAILSALSREQLTQSITSGQSSVLQSVPGIGKKVADRIVVELSNRFNSASKDQNIISQKEDSVFLALRQLGYSAQQANRAIAKVSPKITAEGDRIKQALRNINS